jgi:hypothetical protein
MTRDLLAADGCRHFARAAAPALVTALTECSAKGSKPGERLSCSGDFVRTALQAMLPVAEQCVPGPRPVRAVLFDKSPARNWVVPWHQDRTIAVQQRIEQAGFGPWSVKDGVAHVEPPFALLARMVTLRLHLDDCPADNAPLCVALGTHRARVAAADAAGVAHASPQRACLASAGDIWAYATPIVHMSERALRPSRRRVLQVDFSPDELPGGMEWSS